MPNHRFPRRVPFATLAVCGALALSACAQGKGAGHPPPPPADPMMGAAPGTPVAPPPPGMGGPPAYSPLGGPPITSTRPAPQAVAMLINTKGETIGHIQVTEMASGGVGIGLVATGLTPGVHSFHIHDKGVCDRAVTFETAGGHFNPTGKAHGWNNAAGPHAGDLPNILADGRGKATAGVLTHDVTLRPGVANSLFDADGSSFVIHSGPDDYISQPAGNAGSRVACGVLVHHVALKPQPKP